MTLDAPIRVAANDFTVSGEADRLDFERGFFPDFPEQRLDQGFARFDHAARKCIDAKRGPAGPPHHEHFARAENGSAYRKDRALRKAAVVRQ